VRGQPTRRGPGHAAREGGDAVGCPSGAPEAAGVEYAVVLPEEEAGLGAPWVQGRAVALRGGCAGEEGPEAAPCAGATA